MVMSADAHAQTPAAEGADREKVERIRAELPVTQRYRYFNAGTNGPLPQRTHDTLVANAQLELSEGRIGQVAFTRLLKNLNDTRSAAAKLLGCDAGEITLTRNTTEGMNIAVMGLNWQAGDEVITAETEHPGGLHPVYLLHQRYGVRIRMTKIGHPDLDPIAELGTVLNLRTKAVVLSHVNWATGMVLPIPEMADLAHEHGALFICDAAQAVGMVPSNVYELGVDAYACSGQKWLCGPDGTGALFVRKERRSDIQQTFMSYFAIQPGMSDHDGNYVPSAGGERYEISLGYSGALKGLQASLSWISEEIGWDWVYRRIATLGRYCYAALSALDGVTMMTPQERMAGLVHFRVAGIAPTDLTAKLEAADILIRDTHNPDANRVSTGFYSTEAEIDHLCDAIRRIQAER
jgi:L-cysteine/cystine lyase